MPGLFHVEMQLLANLVVILLLIDRTSAMNAAARFFRAATRLDRSNLLFVTLLTLGICAGLGIAVRISLPAIHDEFAYLLTAETFKIGRLTNPTHPMWEFFESPHLIHQPTYQAKYPPGQGLTMAIGWRVFGHPITGIWLTYSLACGAVYWMLRAYVPARWALIGAMLCVFNACMTLGRVASYTDAFGMVESHGWGQTYWGGGLAMMGGALLFGAFARMIRTPTYRHGAVMGIGLAILANSRPYEGLVASLPVAAVYTWYLCQKVKKRDWQSAVRMVIPVSLVLLIALGCMLIYNYQVTGNPLKMPYQVWKQQYSGPSLLTTLLPAGIGANENIGAKLLIQWEFFVRVLLTVPLLFALPTITRDRRIFLAAITCYLTLMALLMQNTRGNPHYLAPIVAPFTLILVCGFRALCKARLDNLRWGRALTTALLLVYAVSFVYSTAAWASQPLKHRWVWTLQRQDLEEELQSSGEEHLVIVRYTPAHSWFHEWVYNHADIDAAPVVWAHDLGDQRNEKLLEYFAQRQCWLIEVGHDPGPLQRIIR